MKGRSSLIIFIAFVVFATFIVYLFNAMAAPEASHAEHEGGGAHAIADLPANWNGYQRVNAVKGPEALTEINKLHNESIQIHDGYQATYAKSDTNQFTVWIAMANDAANALLLRDQMTAKIGGSNAMFAKPVPVKLGGTDAYRTSGMGQAHFYYAKGSAVYWVALPETNADQLISRILSDL